MACLVAARLGLAVIDGDGAGRAVPSLPMLTYAAAEVSPRPAMLVSQGGLEVELDVKPAAGANGGTGHQQDVAASSVWPNASARCSKTRSRPTCL